MERYTKTQWVPRTTMVSSTNLNKIENQLEAVTDKVIENETNIVNPTGEVATYNTVKAKDAHIGQRGTGMGPHTNNLYVEGSTYMMPKDQAFAVSGPGAPGGNIFLQPAKAICSFTKDGPKQNADGTQDSGIRTIAFVGRVTDEDKINEEDSVFIGTNVSRLYLYSKTAYPTVVSQRENVLFNIDGASKNSEETPQLVQTISPIATQEWVMNLLTSLGLLGGQADKTSYTYASSDATASFDVATSNSWTTVSGFTWNTNSDGKVGFTKNGSGKTSYVPLFQKGTWNEMYFAVDETNYNTNSYALFKTPKYIYGIEIRDTMYLIFAVDKNGRRMFDYQTPLKEGFKEATTTEGALVRIKHDETNKNIVFSIVFSNNSEKKILELSEFSFNGFTEFDKRERCFGIVGKSNTTKEKFLQMKNRPSGFNPSLYGVNAEDYSVVRTSTIQDLISNAIAEQTKDGE